MSKYESKMSLISEIREDASVLTYVNSSEWVRVEHKKRKNIKIAYTISLDDNKLTDFASAVVYEYAQRVAYKSLNLYIAYTGAKRLTEIMRRHKSKEQLQYIIPKKFKKSGKGVFIRTIKDAKANDSEYEDIVGEAVKHFTYLATFYATNPTELWNLREYVYKKLKSYYKSRKAYDNSAELSAIENTEGVICSELFDIDTEIDKIALAKDIYEYFSKKKGVIGRNALKIAQVFVHCMINEYSTVETSKIMGISQSTVSRYLSLVTNNLKNMPEIIKLYNSYYK